MNTIAQGFLDALQLIISLDPELFQIIGLSLTVSGSAVLIAAAYCIPLATWLGLKQFRGKAIFSRLLFTFMSVPSVVVGLVVLLLFSRRGPLGFLGLLYTPGIMIIAQALLVTPLLFGLIYNTVRHHGQRIQHEGYLLGAGRGQRLFLVIWELKAELSGHLIAGFSRAISEVGTVMIVGGNIKGETRVMTTSIAMMNSMGEYQMAIALGVVLLMTALIVNSLIYKDKVT